MSTRIPCTLDTDKCNCGVSYNYGANKPCPLIYVQCPLFESGLGLLTGFNKQKAAEKLWDLGSRA